MSKVARINLQIKDINEKIQRLQVQKELLESKKQRIEVHSKRVSKLQQDRENDKQSDQSKISIDPGTVD